MLLSFDTVILKKLLFVKIIWFSIKWYWRTFTNVSNIIHSSTFLHQFDFANLNKNTVSQNFCDVLNSVQYKTFRILCQGHKVVTVIKTTRTIRRKHFTSHHHSFKTLSIKMERTCTVNEEQKYKWFYCSLQL